MLRACHSVPFCSQHQRHSAVHTTRSRLPSNNARCSPAHRSRHRRHGVIASAENGDKPDQPAAQEQEASTAPKPRGKRKGKKRSTAGKTVSLTLRRSQEDAEEVAEAFTLDDFNPVAIGKRSRQVQWANTTVLSDMLEGQSVTYLPFKEICTGVALPSRTVLGRTRDWAFPNSRLDDPLD